MLAIARILRTGAPVADAGRAYRGTGPGNHRADWQNHCQPEGAWVSQFCWLSRISGLLPKWQTGFYVMEHGRIIDAFATHELEANMAKLNAYLGV